MIANNLKIYQKVITPDGEGILVTIETQFNGLYVEYERAKCVVWYGMDNCQNGWVSREYNLKEIEELNYNKQTIRNDKIDSIISK